MIRFCSLLFFMLGAFLQTGPALADPAVCARMQARLDELTSDYAIDDYEYNLRRDRIEAALDANDCPIRDHQYRNLPSVNDDPPYEVLGQPGAERPAETTPIYGGDYQTLCVRSCDGYYFPLTYQTGAENFQRDQARCEAQCPGAKLFYRPTDRQSPEAMMSLAGQPYGNLPNAFKFRKAGANGTAQCTCESTAGNDKGLGNGSMGKAAETVPAQKPAARADAPVEAKTMPPAAPTAADPVETPTKPAAVEAQQPAPKTDADAKPSAVTGPGEPEAPKAEAPLPKPLSPDKPMDPSRKVRVVGPTFLPDQEGAINLRAPDQKQVR
ncbi:DUF2865 domain-containing protein [Phyllobacterium sp. 21LDTY02-6]|nr:DUF2865 domain-containing protein [Phyllobacterium sp. 21LDTY02-6]